MKHKNKPSRRFNWISSENGDQDQLKALDRALTDFYSKRKKRESYQKMLGESETSDTPGGMELRLVNFILDQQPKNMLEVGCGSGRIYRHLHGKNIKTNCLQAKWPVPCQYKSSMLSRFRKDLARYRCNLYCIFIRSRRLA